MFLLADFLIACARVIDLSLEILLWLIVIRAILSWFEPDRFHRIVESLEKITEPVLYPIRRLLPVSLRFGIDISSLIAFLIITFLKSFLVKAIINIASRL